jgi:hypothetical protein
MLINVAHEFTELEKMMLDKKTKYRLLSAVVIISLFIITALSACNSDRNVVDTTTKSAFSEENLEWVKTVGGSAGEEFISVTNNDDGSFVAAGSTSSSDGDFKPKMGEDIIGKYLYDGTQVWLNQYDRVGYVDISTDKSENLYTNGYAYHYDVISKYDTDGNVVWTKNIYDIEDIKGEKALEPEYAFYSSAAADDGGCVAIGYYKYEQPEHYTQFITYFDSDGNNKWIRTIDEMDFYLLYSVIETNDGNFLVVGKLAETSKDDIAMPALILFDKNGSVLWAKKLEVSKRLFFQNVIQLSDGNFVACGATLTAENDAKDFLLLKFDEDGNLLWAKTYGGEKQDSFLSLCESSDGGAVVVGRSTSSDGDIEENFGSGDLEYGDAIIAKFDKDGNKEWIKNFGGSGDDRLRGVIRISDNEYIAVGVTTSDDHDITERKGKAENYYKFDALIIKFKAD